MREGSYITRAPLRVLSLETVESPGSFLIKPMYMIQRPRAPMVREIPGGERVVLLHCNLNMNGTGDFAVEWKGGKYQVDAPMGREAFGDGDGWVQRYQPIETFKKGKLYRFKSPRPSNLMHKGIKVGAVKPNDIVLYLGAEEWQTPSEEKGFMFQVIHQDATGTVGEGLWATLEELRDNEAR